MSPAQAYPRRSACSSKSGKNDPVRGRKPPESRYRLGAVCGESRTHGSEGEVSRSNTGIDSNEFRNYIGGLLGESERKNRSQMAANAVGVTYHRLHHFLTEAPWDAQQVNERRLEVMNQCSQTRISRGFTLIVDDSGHRKSGNFTAGVGRQYIGEIGKTDNGIVVVTTHLYDGKKSLPLDLELYQHASSLPQGWLGLHEYQVREKRSLFRHFILVFCAYTFILRTYATGTARSHLYLIGIWG